MNRGNRYNKKEKLVITTPSLRLDCFGKRMKAYEKCDDCPHLERCSAETLMRVLTEKGYGVSTRQHGELIHVDPL